MPISIAYAAVVSFLGAEPPQLVGERDALIAAAASGYDVTLETLGLLPAETQIAADLKLRPLKTWWLTVHDPTGKPLAGLLEATTTFEVEKKS